MQDQVKSSGYSIKEEIAHSVTHGVGDVHAKHISHNDVKVGVDRVLLPFLPFVFLLQLYT